MFRFALLILFLVTPVLADSCPACHMEVDPKSSQHFESVREGKPVALCSFACVWKFHKRNPTAPITAIDFSNGKKVDAGKAYFLVKAPKLAERSHATMLPAVGIFEKDAEAKQVQKELGEGKVVKGIDAAIAVYE